jgi:hypothetical protein
MLKGFIFWLDQYLVGEDPSSVVRAALGLMSFAALLGVILGNTAVKLGALLAVIFVILSAMLILIYDRKSLKRQVKSHRGLLTRYCDVLYDESQPVALVKEWKQVATIESNGDTKELITIHAIAMQDLYFLRLRADPKWDQPERQRRRVRVDFRSIHVAGSRGPSWQMTPSWLADGRLEMIAHLHSPVPKRTEIIVEVKRDWPGKCTPLAEGEADTFGFRFGRMHHIEHGTYTVVLPQGMRVYLEPVGFQQPHPGFSVQHGHNQDGRSEVTLTVIDLPVDTFIGMRLQRET